MSNHSHLILRKSNIISQDIKYSHILPKECLKLPPEPFVGDVLKAPVIFLNANPKYLTQDLRDWNNRKYPNLPKAIRDNISYRRNQFPFFYLDPQFEDSNGSIYWLGRLRELVEATDRCRVANGIAVIEFFPYRTKNFGDTSKFHCLPSQFYVRDLVARAIERSALVICVRAKAEWEATLDPRISSKVHFKPAEGKKAQNSYISVKKLGPRLFAEVKNAI